VKIADRVGRVHILRDLIKRRIGIDAEIGVGKIEGSSEASANHPFLVFAGGVSEAKPRGPIILADLRITKSNATRHVGDRAELLGARGHRNRDVLITQAEIEGEAWANPEIIIHVGGMLQKTFRNAGTGSEGTLAGDSAQTSTAGLLIQQILLQRGIVVVAAAALHEEAAQNDVREVVAGLDGVAAEGLGDVFLPG
jgi:hypothetical protein